MTDAAPTKKKGNFVTYTLAFLFIVSLLFIYFLAESHKRSESELDTELSTVEKSLATTKGELSAARKESVELRATNKEQIADWQQRLESSERTVGERDQTIQDLKASHEAALKSLEARHEKALSESEEKHQQTMAAAREQAQADLEAEQAAQAELQGRFDAAVDENTGLMGKIDALNKTMAWLKNGIAEQEKALREQVETYRIALEGSDPERALRLSQMEVKIHQAQEALQKARLDGVLKEADFNNRMAAAEQLAQGKITALDASSRENAELKEQVAALKQELAESREQAAAAAEEMKAAHGAEVKELNDRLTAADQALSEEQARLEENVQKAKEAEAALQGEIDGLKRTAEQQRAQAEATEAGLREQLAGVEQKLSETRQSLADTEALLKETEAKVEAAQAQIDSLNQTLEKEREEAKAAAATAQAAHAAQVEKLEDQVSAVTAKLAKLQEQHDALEKTGAEEREKADATIRSLEEKVASLDGELKKTGAELADVQVSLQKAEADGKALAEQKAALEEQKAALEQELEKERGKLEQVRQEMSDRQQLYQGYSELGARYTDQGMQLTLAQSDLQFVRGGTELPSGDLEGLVRIADFLNQHDNLKVLLKGHTDSAGLKENNLVLSQKRADAVKQALVARGVDEARITTEGVGEAEPIASNQTSEGKLKNRRVEVFITEM